MCAICGCDAHAPDPATGVLHHGAGPAGLSPLRAIQLEADVLGANKRQAARNRAHFAAHGVTAYNLLSSPGSGKTTLLCATIETLRTHSRHRCAGDPGQHRARLPPRCPDGGRRL